jgi:16S rRNA processing protein RimM
VTAIDKARPRVLLGRIGAAHGIRGEVTVQSFTADPFDIAAYGALETGDARPVPRLTVVRETARGLICRLDGVIDRTAAEAWRGTELWIARDRLPPPQPGSYYHADLIGLTAVAPDGALVGTVVEIANFGAGDLVEVRLHGTTRTEYVPFSDAFVPDVDLAHGRITVVMPPAGDDENGEP